MCSEAPTFSASLRHCQIQTEVNRIHKQIPVLMLKKTNFCCLTVNIPHPPIEIGGCVSSRVVGMGRSLTRVVRTRLRNAFDMESLHCLRSVQRRAYSAWRPVRKQNAPIIQSRLVVSLRIYNKKIGQQPDREKQRNQLRVSESRVKPSRKSNGLS